MTKSNMVTMVTVKASGEIVEAEVAINNLRAFQTAVGGDIQVIPYCELFEHKDIIRKCIALCDEEGKLKGKPVNRTATAMWHRGLAERLGAFRMDVLVGDIAFVFGDPEIMAQF
ncbi:DUF3846 domain-containing protein [Mesorhizobium phage Cp1R7A-A1]|nr:DUF3846 domain-containing protein [Mesorhizobium phage Cp1R7A-A1]